MKTRSEKSSQVSALGRRSGGAEDDAASALKAKPPRAGDAELQPGGGRARTAVEQERHRPGARIGTIQLIGGIGDIGLRLALVVEQPDRTRRGREIERAPRQRQRLSGGRIRRQPMLLGDDRRSRRSGGAASGFLAGWRRCGLRLRSILGARAGQHRERQKHNRDPSMARRGESDGHIRSLPASAINAGAAIPRDNNDIA